MKNSYPEVNLDCTHTNKSVIINQSLHNVWDQCDAILMLTYSNWATEMRSNRYHYATRFAQHKPVFFVQPTRPPFLPPRIQASAFPHLFLLEIAPAYTAYNFKKMLDFLQKEGVRFPLLWIYNHHFKFFIQNCPSLFKVYHATEDYFSTFFTSPPKKEDLRQVLFNTDLLIAVSEGVAESYQQNGLFDKKILTLTNGCDYTFWSKPSSQKRGISKSASKYVLYQGNINHKICFSLLEKVVAQNPSLEFWFCGEVLKEYESWSHLLKRPNVKFWGKLPPENVRDLAHQADVGIIPFTQHDAMVDKSFPLKSFEYIAANLPVVSTPIRSLKPFEDVILFAETAEEFSEKISQALHLKDDPTLVERRRRYAQLQDYDRKFEALLQEIQSYPQKSSLISPLSSEKITLKTLTIHVLENSKLFLAHLFNYIFFFLSLQQREWLKEKILEKVRGKSEI